MKRIGLFIQASNQELFQINTNILKEYYNKVIRENNLNMDVYSFTADEQSASTYLDGDTIYCDCSDHSTYLKTFKVFEYILDNMNYEWVLFTNNSTLVNIVKLYNEIGGFDKNQYHYPFKFKGIVSGPSGNIKLMTPQVMKKLCDVRLSVYDLAKSMYQFQWTRINNDKNIWHDVPEDYIISFCLWRAGLYYEMVSLMGYYATMFDYAYWYAVPNIDFNQLYFLTFKTPFEYDQRLQCEPDILRGIIHKIEKGELLNEVGQYRLPHLG